MVHVIRATTCISIFKKTLFFGTICHQLINPVCCGLLTAATLFDFENWEKTVINIQGDIKTIRPL